MVPKHRLHPERVPRAPRYPDRASLMAATLDRCKAELASVDPLVLALDQTTWAVSCMSHQASAQTSKLVRSLVRTKVEKPSHATPLAAFVARCPGVDSYDVALRAFLVGYEPTLAGRAVTSLTTSDVLATVRKAVDAIRKVHR
jgi:hypothetical protein